MSLPLCAICALPVPTPDPSGPEALALDAYYDRVGDAWLHAACDFPEGSDRLSLFLAQRLVALWITLGARRVSEPTPQEVRRAAYALCRWNRGYDPEPPPMFDLDRALYGPDAGPGPRG